MSSRRDFLQKLTGSAIAFSILPSGLLAGGAASVDVLAAARAGGDGAGGDGAARAPWGGDDEEMVPDGEARHAAERPSAWPGDEEW